MFTEQKLKGKGVVHINTLCIQLSNVTIYLNKQEYYIKGAITRSGNQLVVFFISSSFVLNAISSSKNMIHFTNHKYQRTPD